MGDAVILSGLANALRSRYPGLAIDILGRHGLREVSCAFSSFREYIEIELPLYGHHRRDSASLKSALRTILLLRRSKYDCCINTIGDVRENLISRLVCARTSIAPLWESGHLFKHKVTDKWASLFLDCGVRIPSGYTSYYDSLEYFARQLDMPGLLWNRDNRVNHPTEGPLKVALHPGASHPSRHWPVEKWQALIRELRRRDCRLTLIGSPAEGEALRKTFAHEISAGYLILAVEPIPRFLETLKEADFLIGMDSFSVHAAYALGVPAVVLNGSADARILTPPAYPAVSAGHLCRNYPCYNAFPCQQSEAEYVCVREIKTEVVLQALEGLWPTHPVRQEAGVD